MGAMGSLDGSEPFAPTTPPSVTGEDLVREEDIPMPSFGDGTRRRARRLRFQDSEESLGGASDVGASSSGGSYDAPGGQGAVRRGFRGEHGGLDGGLLRDTGEGNMSPMQDPWEDNDPWSGRQQHWQVNAAENWSDLASDRHSASGSDHGSSWSWSSSRWSAREWERWQNWDSSSSMNYDDQSEEGKYSNWTRRSSAGYDDPWRKWSSASELLDGRALSRDDHGQEHRLGEGERSDQQPQGGEGTGATPLSPTSPQAQRLKDKDNRPMGEIPSGVPSVAGNNSQQQAPGASGKISSSYPPIFNARPGESWEQYWRSVTFWVASEGKSLPAEMQGPRLMQQLRERAAKIVQHLTVSDVSGSDGIQKIKEVMERSPIIKLLDQKKIDQRRQKFMRLARLSGESIESFLNRAEIYRRENQTSPAYQVGSKFYIGHLLDAAKLTKRDLALIKAASGGSLEEEDAVTTSLMDLSEQLEGQAGCPIGKGEPTLDQEDKYLVQKATSSSMSSPLQSATQSSSGGPGGRRGNRRRFFGRRRFRDALMAILEDEDAMEEPMDEDNFMAEFMGEESMDDDEDDITSFGGSTTAPVLEASNASTTTSTTSSSASSLPDFSMAEIYAQEYKARNRVKEIKKMRQYFQREAGGQPQGGRDREQVKQWVREQQKTEPCFICRQLGHWSQECPYRNKAPIHATNVTFPSAGVSEANWALLQQCAQSDAKYKRAPQGVGVRHFRHCFVTSPTSTSETITGNEVYWSMAELGNKMIVDLGCMKTVAGTTWINPMVTKWKQNGWYCKVVPEKESFRFGDGHVNQSRFAVIVHVNIAGISCLLRISVVSGDCPPLLSKPVCTALGLLVDTSSHTLSSSKFGIKTYGLQQSAGGHYVVPIDEVHRLQAVPSEFQFPSHCEVYPLNSSGSTVKCSPRSRPLVRTVHSTSDGRPMGKRGHSRRGRGHIVGGAGTSAANRQIGASPSITGAVGDEEEIRQPSARDQPEHAGPTGADEPDGSHDDAASGDSSDGESQSEEQARGVWAEYHPDQGEQEGGADRQRSGFSHSVQQVQLRPHLQHPRQLDGTDPDLQVEDDAAAAASQEGCRGRQDCSQEMEEEPTMGVAHARALPGQSVGTHRERTSTMLQPQGVSPGLSRRGTAGAEETGIEGIQLTDPNAPTTVEQRRRAIERCEIVLSPQDRERIEGLMMPPGQQQQLFGEGIEELHPSGDLPEELRQSGDLPKELHQSGDLSEEPHQSGDLPEEPHQEKGVLHGEAQSRRDNRRITLNRRQARSIRQGVQKALKVQQRIYAAAHMKQRPWVLMELFAGKATLSSMANQSTKWEVLPPQDVLYGLDLKDEQHQQWLKDVIETQRPDVVSLSPPCGPWSSWQRMRKRRDLLEALRREHQPFWDLVCWVWAFQTAHGGLVVLEQPKQSDALKMPKMTQRKQVYEKEVHMCQMGLVDRVSGDPHKKSTAIQMNHPVILTEVFPDRKCDHPPGAHQPIEGHVRIWDEQQCRHRQVRRSTLAAEWTPDFCGWLLDGLEAIQEEAAQTFHLELHREVPFTKVWEAVPVELEPTPEGQLRQHLQQQEHGTRYDYISFSGDAAMVNKTMRSTLAHLHVALGHVTNDKLKRMMLLNGAKPELASIIDHLECQICKQVKSPMATPKAAFQRPMQFNERIVADSFYIWDSENTKYAVTHVLDTFSLYQIAVAAQDPSSEGTTALLRDRWIGVFGPPAVLMTDQGSEFHGQLEPLLTTFGTFHEMVPPTAHWRMSLAERHGAVLKVLLMKIIKEQSIIGLQQLQMAVVAPSEDCRILADSAGVWQRHNSADKYDGSTGRSFSISIGETDFTRGVILPSEPDPEGRV